MGTTIENNSEKQHMSGYIDYIFNLIYISENMVILNKNDHILNFITKCEEKYESAQLISFFDSTSLYHYDATLRLLANVIFERVPHAESIELDSIPSMSQFKAWLAALTKIDIFTLLYFLDKRAYINIKNPLHFDYMIDVIYTLKVI